MRPPGYPTMVDLYAVAAEYGVTIDRVERCEIQGVLIQYSRPIRRGETLFGLPVASAEGDGRSRQEIVERHYCPGDAAEAIMNLTNGRAIQRTIWAIEGHGR